MSDKPRHWSELSPQDAADIVLPQPGIIDCLDDMGDPCPWPWWPTRATDLPGGMAHCPHCGSMVVLGLPHPDFTCLYTDREWTSEGEHASPA